MKEGETSSVSSAKETKYYRLDTPHARGKAALTFAESTK